jgi:hypothetical protein
MLTAYFLQVKGRLYTFIVEIHRTIALRLGKVLNFGIGYIELSGSANKYLARTESD